MIKGKIGETYHISTDKLIKIRDLVKLIITKVKKNFKIVKISKERR